MLETDPNRKVRSARNVIFGAIALLLVVLAGVAGYSVIHRGSASGPSAQCRSQLHQVAVLQGDANAIENSSVVVANGQLARFNSDVNTAGHLLKLMHSENCPNGGY